MSNEPEGYLELILQRVKAGEVFTIDQGGQPVAIVVPPRYLEKLTDHFDDWNDGRLVLPGNGHGWRRVWHLLRWVFRNLNKTVQNPPPPDNTSGAYEVERL